MPPVKILYVEDELFLGKIVKESLESRSYNVIMEPDGDKALPLFVQHRPDVCVLDVMLPNKDGFTIAEEIREVDKAVPIIFLTAKTQTEDLVKGFKTGGNDYIRKPFSMEELIVRIENALRFRNGETGLNDRKDIVKIGKYTFHMNHQILKNNGDERKLSFRESELLKVFTPFYCCQEDHNPQAGSIGLGLAIAKRAISLHHGLITLKNRPEGGLIAEISIPA
mgnify:CR=1 FL=1